MQFNKTKKLVDGAIIAAIFGALFLVDLYLGGIFGYYLSLILPVLIVWYGERYDFKDMMALVVAVLCVTFFITSFMNLYYAVSSLLAGIVIACCIKKKTSSTTIFFSTTTIMLISNILLYTVFAGIFDMDLIGELTEIYQQLSLFLSRYLSEGTFMTLDQLLQYAPLFILMIAIVEAYLILLFMSLILPRLKVNFDYQFNFLLMSCPKLILILTLIFIVLAYVFPQYILIKYLDVIFKAIIVLQGFTCVALYCSLHRQLLFYILVTVLMLVPYAWPIYGIVGVIDILIGLKAKFMYNRHSKRW